MNLFSASIVARLRWPHFKRFLALQLRKSHSVWLNSNSGTQVHKHMGIFQYTATDRTAKIIQGSMEAADERAVVTWLQANGYSPIKIGQAGAMGGARPSLVRGQSR